jgi:hypothetical protein
MTIRLSRNLIGGSAHCLQPLAGRQRAQVTQGSRGARNARLKSEQSDDFHHDTEDGAKRIYPAPNLAPTRETDPSPLYKNNIPSGRLQISC